MCFFVFVSMRFVEKRAALRIQSNVRSGRFDEVGRIMFFSSQEATWPSGIWADFPRGGFFWG